MKKFIAITATVSALALTQIQEATSQEVTFGIKGGLNSSEATMPLASSVDRTRAKGFHAGAFLEVQVTPRVGLQLEVLFSEKGFGGKRVDRALTYEMESSYVEVPLLAKVRAPWTLGNQITPYLFGGPSVAFEVDCQIRGKDGPEHLYYRCDGPPIHFDQRKKLDFGLMIGAGMELPLPVGRLLVDLTYDWGMRDLADSPDIPGAVRHGAIMISGGFATGRGR